MPQRFLATEDGAFLLTEDGLRILVDGVVDPTRLRPPSPPDYSRMEYAAALLALLPSGRAWPREPDAVLVQVVQGLAPTLERLGRRAAALMQDAPAGDLLELLLEWEETLGLPDTCSGTLVGDVDSRRRAVRAAISARGGQSIPYFVGICTAMGLAVTVQEFASFRAGQSRAGSAACGEGWDYTWRITAQDTVIMPFRANQSVANDPLQYFGNRALECLLNRIKPAHTILQFAYT